MKAFQATLIGLYCRLSMMLIYRPPPWTFQTRNRNTTCSGLRILYWYSYWPEDTLDIKLFKTCRISGAVAITDAICSNVPSRPNFSKLSNASSVILRHSSLIVPSPDSKNCLKCPTSSFKLAKNGWLFESRPVGTTSTVVAVDMMLVIKWLRGGKLRYQSNFMLHTHKFTIPFHYCHSLVPSGIRIWVWGRDWYCLRLASRSCSVYLIPSTRNRAAAFTFTRRAYAQGIYHTPG